MPLKHFALNAISKIITPQIEPHRPEILAPAGGKNSFLAAIAAGADAVYCGMQRFSARMAAENFTIEELMPLARLAHDRGVKVYIALNSLIKPDELDASGRLLDQLSVWVKPDALIIADLALISLAQQTGFEGEIHLSTLANVSFPEALKAAGQFPRITRVVLPREISVDEIKAMAAECPPGLSLEVFVHGALCYGVSGRCYWSSFLGGKSGLRGRCVQPCRRIYEQKGDRRRFFSCNDLWTDVLTKVLVNIPRVSGVKIEGRKKGPHYVYYTVSAYRLFRDHSDDPKMKKTALSFLEYALGRKGTHYNFLPQRPQNPIDVNVQTGSGMMVGRVSGPASAPFIHPRMELLPHDLLRIGYEDDAFHATLSVNKYVAKNIKFILKLTGKARPQAGTPVFLIDRRDTELDQQMNRLCKELKPPPAQYIAQSQFKTKLKRKASAKLSGIDMTVRRDIRFEKPGPGREIGVWIADDERRTGVFNNSRMWFWLPPVIWPADEGRWKSLIDRALAKRCAQFVLNAPWQTAFFHRSRGVKLWAGPFCNIANPLAVEAMMSMGFSGVIVSPELGEAECAALPALSPLPLGIVVSGNWPLCVSRTISEDIKTGSFFSSPRGEQAWACRHGADVWVFPNWTIDLVEKKETLQKFGYKMFVHLEEPLPKQIHLKKRPGLWNWSVGLT